MRKTSSKKDFAMHTETEPITSARRAWDKATAAQRLTMLREAGHNEFARAYQKFVDLPIGIKLDLNAVATRNASREAVAA